jgi:voltage-gated potassium channel
VLYRIRWAINSLIALFFIATAGYALLEHYSVLDSAFMTVITLSTVGYNEVRPLDGAGQLFSIGVIIAGFGCLAYAGAMITGLFTSGEVADHLHKSRTTRMRHDTKDHVIVVGFGRVGQSVAQAVAELGHPCVVMDRNADREALIAKAGLIPCIGDATSEVDLIEAGIERAVALVAAAEEDAVNLVITLTARAMRKDLRIISRVNEHAWQDRIVHAGASVAQSPYRSYGLTLATTALHSSVLDTHVLPTLGLVAEEIEVSANSELAGQPLHPTPPGTDGVILVGLRRDSRFHRWNELSGPIEAGDVLVALGTQSAVDNLARRA